MVWHGCKGCTSWVPTCWCSGLQCSCCCRAQREKTAWRLPHGGTHVRLEATHGVDVHEDVAHEQCGHGPQCCRVGPCIRSANVTSACKGDPHHCSVCPAAQHMMSCNAAAHHCPRRPRTHCFQRFPACNVHWGPLYHLMHLGGCDRRIHVATCTASEA